MKIRAESLRQAIGSTVAQQIVLMVLSLMILDGGVVAEICAFSAGAFWVGVGVIYMRRRKSISKSDLLVIEAGFLPLFVGGVFLCALIWRLRGVGPF